MGGKALPSGRKRISLALFTVWHTVRDEVDMEDFKVAVDTKELVQRINKVLVKGKHRLVKSRSSSDKSNLGDWYVISTSTNAVTAWHSDITELAQETAALLPHEYFDAEILDKKPPRERDECF
jgi:hypothetical protein